ncbi:MAG: serine/threonine protein kinase [Ruminococcus flavefaciens]|nr:serine/threonine protein kinase [Ruminococcus flavefaciens]MCM1234318.1 serine/threonine protein kinase [Ruminococcus flavefaciens]
MNSISNDYYLVKELNNSEDNPIYLYRHRTTRENIVVHINNSADSGVYEVYNLLKMIRHRHITKILDTARTGSGFVATEEYIDGITLGNMLCNSVDGSFTAMNPTGVRRILAQLCDGLFVLHSMGIIHRDINPNNIMIAVDGTVKIIDFDISKLYKSADTRDGIIRGTVGYAPYEQYNIRATDERTDIFAVGVLANKLLTGKHPAVELYTKGKLGRLIARCTDISPDRRFNSADELLDFIT